MKSNRWVGNETTRSRSNPVFCNTTRTTNENLVKQHLISQEKDRRDECDEEVKQEQPGGDTPQRLLPLSLWCWPWQTPIPAPHHASSLSHRSVKQPAWQKSALIHPSPVCFHSNPIQVCFGSRAGEGWQFGFGCVDVFFLLHVLIDRCDIVAWEHSRLPVVRSFPPVGVGVVQHLDKSTAAEAWLAVLLCVEVKQCLWNVTERRKRQKRGHREDTEWTMHILSTQPNTASLLIVTRNCRLQLKLQTLRYKMYCITKPTQCKRQMLPTAPLNPAQICIAHTHAHTHTQHKTLK